MLVLTRKLWETIVLVTPTIVFEGQELEGWTIEVTPVEIRDSGRIRLSFKAADQVKIYRKELANKQPLVIGDYADFVRKNRQAKHDRQGD